MKYIFFILAVSSFLFGVDYDCIVIGTSPFSLFEALYQYHSGKKVLILEEASACGGAWKSITVCGVEKADLGCHQIGHDLQLKAFLEEYAGCNIVSLDHPTRPFETTNSPNGFYFSEGCYELIAHLEKLLKATKIDLLLNQKLESISLDPSNTCVTARTKELDFTTSKIVITPTVSFGADPSSKSKCYHLYLLIQDPTPVKFCYHSGGTQGVSRMINLTPFTKVDSLGQQIIAIQTHNESYLNMPHVFLDAMKEKNLVDQSAYILRTEPYTYESGRFNQQLLKQWGVQNFVEIMTTGHISNLVNYVPKWTKVLKPYKEALENF